MSERQKSLSSKEVAIIGMVGRFPGAEEIETFWENLRNGVESVSFYTEQEMAESGIHPELFRHPNYIKAKGAIADIDLFDADFFGYTPREAAAMDPQQRTFLESAWQALENAGYDPFRYEGWIGVYAGAAELSYMTHLLNASNDPVEAAKTVPIFFGNALDFLTSHVAYKCNLRGPSITVQTACSTSLVAIHLACQSLLNYECDMALAGGVSISAPNKEGYLYEEGSVESPDGHCRAFDRSAKGTVPSNGVGIVVIKRLQDALEDGDTIHAVIKGSAINNDGSHKVGYTAPSPEGQAEAISLAQSVAGVGAEEITYVETHGTGTPLGDPIEIKALTQAFQATTAKTGYCAIGSLKTNLGHLKAAAGVAGLIKTVLALKHKQIPPSLHFQSPNSQIDFANSPFYVNTQLTEWQHSPRIAGVSSFGIGGTNAHMVLEEAPEPIETQQSFRPYQLLILSARTATALKTAVANLAAHLRQHPEINLGDAAFTLQNGRRIFEHRCFVVAKDAIDAIQALDVLSAKPVLGKHCPTKAQSVVFLFPGQGCQYVNMGRELYDIEPRYREEVDRCAEYLRNHLDIDLCHILYPDHAQPATNLLDGTYITQVALFVVEYALARLLISWGVKPDAMLGECIGEYVAATLAGVYSLEEALTRVNAQGRLMQEEKATTSQTVRFADRLEELFQKSAPLFIEVGPGETLSNFVRQHPQSAFAQNILSTIPHAQAESQKLAWLSTVLGQLWLSGVEVDWTAFWSAQKRSRIPLPTYPFERQRYWFEPMRSPAIAPPSSSGKTANVADWFYVPSWKRSLTPTPSAEFRPLKKCLLFMDNSGLGSALATRLETAGSTIFTVRIGQEFSFGENYNFTINPSQSKDYETLIAEIIQQIGTLDTIVHCWNVDPISPMEGDADREYFEKAQEKGFYSLLYLTQALGKSKITAPIKILAIASETQAVESTDTLSPEKTTLLGSCLVISQEYSHFRCQAIDIPILSQKRAFPTLSELAERLLLELKASTTEPRIAYRGAYRLVQNFESVKLEAASDAKRLRKRGVYIITGGLGNMGMVLSEYLASNYQAKLVIVSHRPFPKSHQWQEWLANHGKDHDNARQIARFQEMEAAGAQVEIFQADVSNEEQMRIVIDRTKEVYGAIHGVIHCAANVKNESFSAIYETDQNKCEQQFQPKIYGAQVLKKLLQNEPIDFYLLMSSLAGILGGVRFSAYAAANLFLDAFAHQNNQNTAASWCSVNWDGWEMSLTQDQKSKWTSTQYALSTQEGVEVFHRILSMPNTAQIAVSTGNLQTRIEQWVKLQSLPQINEVQKESPSPYTRPDINSVYKPPSNYLERIVAQIWQEVLGIELVGIDDDFFQLNGDSLHIVQVVSRIRETLGVAITPDLVFENSTVAGLVSTITNNEFQKNPTYDIPKLTDRSEEEISSKVKLLSEEKVSELLEELLSAELNDAAAENT